MLRCDQQTQVIDSDGFRLNVGIILSNREGKLFWARRIGQNAWQFPQGGIHHNETPEEALYRELMEEIGLTENHVDIVGCTKNWLRYRLPKRLIRRKSAPLCIGQKQMWYMLRFVGDEEDVCLNVSEKPEFDHWRWVSYWHPLKEVVFFKRKVYESALHELAPLLFSEFQGIVRAKIPPKPAVNQRRYRHDSKKIKP
jgi:putative (di)nucleoside polyphosphate hydrolase